MPGTLATAMAFGVLAALPAALMPLAIGRAIDAALGHGNAQTAGEPDDDFLGELLGVGAWGFGGSLITWVTVILLLGVVQTISLGLAEYHAGMLWIRSAVRVQRAVLAHGTRVGAALPRKIRSGDVVAIGSTDVYSIGAAFEVIGRTFGSFLAFVLVAGLLLNRSPLLGAVVLIGVPIATAGLAPLLGPLRRRTEEHRERVGDATTIAADIVSGLRILRGIGGERRFADRFAETSQRVRRAGVAAGRIDAWLSGIEVFLPGLVTVAVIWLGARLVLAGELTVGELVAFYGVAAYLVIPVSTATGAAHVVSEALVAGGRVIKVLRLEPTLSSPENPTPLPVGPLGLHDPESGLRCAPGALTVVRTEGSAEDLADRLGRYTESGVTIHGGLPLREADLAEVRRRILVAHNQDVLFSGRLRNEVRLGAGVSLDEALWAADASDVVAGLPDGLEEKLVERGRQLSGGQRQRLMLARALTADPDVLVLDEPTSAVDAHTEARIARRVAHLRRGRTTVVISRSPLWAAVADATEEHRS